MPSETCCMAKKHGTRASHWQGVDRIRSSAASPTIPVAAPTIKLACAEKHICGPDHETIFSCHSSHNGLYAGLNSVEKITLSERIEPIIGRGRPINALRRQIPGFRRRSHVGPDTADGCTKMRRNGA